MVRPKMTNPVEASFDDRLRKVEIRMTGNYITWLTMDEAHELTRQLEAAKEQLRLKPATRPIDIGPPALSPPPPRRVSK